MTTWKDNFNQLADGAQSNIQTAVDVHLGVIGETLDIIRNENVALESERNPEFRRCVEEETRNATAEIKRFLAVLRR